MLTLRANFLDPRNVKFIARFGSICFWLWAPWCSHTQLAVWVSWVRAQGFQWVDVCLHRFIVQVLHRHGWVATSLHRCCVI